MAVNLLGVNMITAAKPGEYACPADCCTLFVKEMQSLYLLSLLITANHKNAESCFLASLEECTRRAGFVLKDDLHLSARQTIIKNAILILFSHKGEKDTLSEDFGRQALDLLRAQERDAAISSILVLEDLDRAAFVICVLERYSQVSCASLLGCPQIIVKKALERALHQSANHQLQRTAVRYAVAV